MKSHITAITLAFALFSLSGCAAIGQHNNEKRQVATFQVQIKEIGSDKKTHVLHSPTITALVGSTGEWRNIQTFSEVEGKVERHDGYIVAIQPTVEGYPEGIGMKFLVDQFTPDAMDGYRSRSISVSDVRSEPYIYWQAAGKQYIATARLLSLE